MSNGHVHVFPTNFARHLACFQALEYSKVTRTRSRDHRKLRACYYQALIRASLEYVSFGSETNSILYLANISASLTFRDTTALAATALVPFSTLSTPPFVPTHDAKRITCIALEP
jgi:hypothetical protein